MEVHVTPLKIKGQLKQKWMRAMGNAVGTLEVRDKRDTVNKRGTLVAELANHRPKRAEGERWLLFDVKLVWAKGSMFLLAGNERHVEWSGVTTDYSQTWLVSIPAPGSTVSTSPGAVVIPDDLPIEEPAGSSV